MSAAEAKVKARAKGSPKVPAKVPRFVKDLVPDPENRRAHNRRNIGMVVDSLQSVGAARSIVIDENNKVLAGNGVTEAAPLAGITRLRVVDAKGDELIAVRRSGLTAAQKRALAIADNRATELSTWNLEQLRADVDAGLSLAPFFTADELQALLEAEAAQRPGRTSPDAIPAVRRTSIKAGDLFELGRHRLLCGDSTSGDTVARLLAGERPVLMVTDPPYGVNYDPEWRARAGVNKNRRKLGKVANDDRADWTEVWRLFPGQVAYVWHAGMKGAIVQASLEQAGFGMRAQIIWAKDRMALSRGDYHWQHEPCWYAVREGTTGVRTPDRSQTTLWRIPVPKSPTEASDASTVWNIASRDDSGHTHGTQKPVECMARPMRNHLAAEVWEPFAGAGTSIIAAEMLGRRCFALELDPSYVQVSIDRWEAFTGQKARKVADAA